MPCHVMSCRFMLCQAMPCHAMLCHVTYYAIALARAEGVRLFHAEERGDAAQHLLDYGFVVLLHALGGAELSLPGAAMQHMHAHIGDLA